MTGARDSRVLHAVGGPAVFALLVLLPLPGVPYPVRAGIGLLVWSTSRLARPRRESAPNRAVEGPPRRFRLWTARPSSSVRS